MNGHSYIFPALCNALYEDSEYGYMSRIPGCHLFTVKHLKVSTQRDFADGSNPSVLQRIYPVNYGSTFHFPLEQPDFFFLFPNRHVSFFTTVKSILINILKIILSVTYAVWTS